jgi:hypothetical protein
VLNGTPAFAGVATGEKDLGTRSVDDMPVAVGAIIYGFHRHRLNEITSESGKVTGAVINPGRWALSGQRITDSKR